MKKELREFIDKHIGKGARINDRDKYGNTALMYASIRINPETVKLLIEAKADMNVKDEYGNTALMWALHWGRTENANLLIEAETDISLKNKYRDTALNCARCFGYKEIEQLLIRKIREKRKEKILNILNFFKAKQ